MHGKLGCLVNIRIKARYRLTNTDVDFRTCNNGAFRAQKRFKFET
jgi:hypothetical protein